MVKTLVATPDPDKPEDGDFLDEWAHGLAPSSAARQSPIDKAKAAVQESARKHVGAVEADTHADIVYALQELTAAVTELAKVVADRVKS